MERAVVQKTCSMLAADVASILSTSNTTTALAAPHAPRPASSSHLPSNTNTQPTTLPRSTFTESATQTNHRLFVQSGIQTESMTVVQSSTQTNDTTYVKLLEERVSHLENTTTSLHEQKRDADKVSDRLSIALRKATDLLRSLQERYDNAQLEILTLRQGTGLLQDTERSIAVDPPSFPRQTFTSYTPHHPSIDPALLSSHHTFTNYDSRLFALDSMGQTRLLLMRYLVYLPQILFNHLRCYAALKVSWLSHQM
jgi:hypothetical protein